jgi:formylglycine-generating enzyme required for sulfatase activity
VKLKALFDGDDGYPTTAPVGSYPAGASRFGPVDVVGNVWEWVADRYGPYTEDDVTDPVGPAQGGRRVMRGGAFNGSMDAWLRPAYRYSAPESQRSHAIGFRCARSLASSK